MENGDLSLVQKNQQVILCPFCNTSAGLTPKPKLATMFPLCHDSNIFLPDLLTDYVGALLAALPCYELVKKKGA